MYIHRGSAGHGNGDRDGFCACLMSRSDVPGVWIWVV